MSVIKNIIKAVGGKEPVDFNIDDLVSVNRSIIEFIKNQHKVRRVIALRIRC